MKKVVLLGDSIRQIGYGKVVADYLGEDYTIWQPDDNCRFAQYTLRGLQDWKTELTDADIIHWNNGLWDACEYFGDGLFTPIDDYVKMMVRIGKLLLQITPNVIFATTTPVTPQNTHIRNETLMEMNAKLVPELTKLGIRINDLHGLVYPKLDEFIRKDDNIHLTEAGIEACAKAVAEQIRRFS